MITVGLRELRQNASRLVEQVEAGEEVLVTVSGRAAARLVGVEHRRPATAAESNAVTALFADPGLGDLAGDLACLDDRLDDRDPWDGRG